jgi:ABC-2 type transport system ATP-binding protein
VREYLEYVAQLYKVDKKRIPTVIEQTVLGPEQHKKIGSLSKGYRQRVGLAAALIPDPEVLILDEPTTGLDPAQLIEIRALLKNIATDKTVLFSTHIMQEVVELCDTVVFLQAGEIKQQCNRAEIEQGSAHLERLFSA